MVCPKLEFPLTVTQFTQVECDRITASVRRACLSKMGYNPNMPKEVVYGPPELFGLGMHDYYIEQGIKQVATLVGHIRQTSDTSHMIRIELQWCRLQAGTALSLLTHPEVSIDYIKTCWIMGVRDFLHTYGFKIDFSRTTLPQVQCENDEFIMDALRLCRECSTSDLQHLNACHMFLQESRLSDSISADGKII